MDAHFPQEAGREILYGCCADDELAIHAHETLRVELIICFFEGHVQRIVFALEGAEAHHTIADSDVTRIADRDDQETVMHRNVNH